VYLAGTSSVAGSNSADFVMKLDRTGAQVQPVLRLPRGVVNGPPSFNGAGALMLPGVGGALLTVPADYTERVCQVAVVHDVSEERAAIEQLGVGLRQVKASAEGAGRHLDS
jgi:hypothetical protein